MVLDLLLLVLAALRAACRRRGDLVVEILLLRHQLAVLTRPTRRRRVRLRRLDKALWVLVRRLRLDWRRNLVVVTPDTVIRWHRAGWRLYWRWRSRSLGGRPPLSLEIRELITRMSRESPLWGSERIRGELLKLGIAVSNRSVRRYRSPGSPRPPSQTWRAFLANHTQAIWAADLFVVQTLTFKTLNVLLFISHGRRELVHLAATAHPAAAWIWRQVAEAAPWGRRPKYLIRDRDAVYGQASRVRAEALGIATVLTPVRAPRANAVAERVIGTLRRACLDPVIPLDEAHLRALLAEYGRYYNRARPAPHAAARGAATSRPRRRRIEPVRPFTPGAGRPAPRVRACLLRRPRNCRPTTATPRD